MVLGAAATWACTVADFEKIEGGGGSGGTGGSAADGGSAGAAGTAGSGAGGQGGAGGTSVGGQGGSAGNPCQEGHVPCGDGCMPATDTCCGGWSCGPGSECGPPETCRETSCTNGVDDDGDQDADCADSDCATNPSCTDSENTSMLCTDGVDNDGDTMTDCDDSECQMPMINGCVCPPREQFRASRYVIDSDVLETQFGAAVLLQLELSGGSNGSATGTFVDAGESPLSASFSGTYSATLLNVSVTFSDIDVMVNGNPFVASSWSFTMTCAKTLINAPMQNNWAFLHTCGDLSLMASSPMPGAFETTFGAVLREPGLQSPPTVTRNCP